MRLERVYMQYNINDSQALFWCSVLIILEMASLDTLFLCSAGQQPWPCSYLVLKFFIKTKAFVLIKLFFKKKKSVRKWWGTLNIIGPKFGYDPAPTKTWLVVKPYASQGTTNIFSRTKIKTPMKGTDTLERQLVQRNLKVPLWKR